MNGNIPAYNLKAVTNETGLTPATLRAWERRYRLFTPQRSSGGQRLYTENEINLLKWLIERQREGLSISRAVDLWRSQVDEANAENQIPADSQAAHTTVEGTLDHLRQTWREACLAFNEAEAELAAARALAIAAPEVVCTQLLQKGLAEIGAGWYAGTVSTQQEHFASSLVARRLHALFAIAPALTHPGRLLAACPPGENHDLALLMLAFIMRWRGWSVIYLGANVPLDQLDATLQTTSPHLVLSAAQTLPGAASLSELARFTNARSIPLAFGGGIFNQVDGLSERIAGYFLSPTVDAAPREIERLLAHPPSQPAACPLSPACSAALAAFTEKEALIVARVRQILTPGSIDPRYIETANAHFTRSVAAALALGDMRYLNHSVEWLGGFLENHGLSPELANQYFDAFQRAAAELIGPGGEPVVQWRTRFEKRL